MTYCVRYTASARKDLLRLMKFLATKNLYAARHAKKAIEEATKLLTMFPFSCRKASEETPLLRELLISFGSSGYVALFEITNSTTVTILAVRHQREDDYY